jgi:spectinomycin phosphotransferase
MLEKPDLQDERVVACLQDEYELRVAHVVFLPLGADLNTAVYRVVTDDQTPYFLKLRRAVFDEISAALPKFLSDHGIVQVVAPLTTRTGQLWASLDAFKVLLYPFVEGHNGYEVALSDQHWSEFGRALKSIHTVDLPPTLSRHIQRETYSPQWRETVKTFLERIEDEAFDEPVAVKLAAFLGIRRDQILDLVGRAARLAQSLQARSPQFVLCHSDIHAGNILIDANDAVYLVDWDNPILAAKERDLMFIGGGQMGSWHTPQEEETLFYRGYGHTQIEPIALAYYRYERIIQDIAIFCEQILLTNEGGEDRAQSLQYLTSSFLPNHVLEIAYRSDESLRGVSR